MALHKDLTGADLHEPKGVAAAAANRVYVSDGLGSGSWIQLPASGLDNTSVKNLNKFQLLIRVPDIANTSVVLAPTPQACRLTAATSVITGAVSGGDATLTFTRAGSATIGTIVIAATGSGEGIIDTLSTPANNDFTAGSWLKIACDGGPTSGTSDAYITLEFTLL